MILSNLSNLALRRKAIHSHRKVRQQAEAGPGMMGRHGIGHVGAYTGVVFESTKGFRTKNPVR
jgi:hypothetical protein